mgnify:FL=1
MAETFDTRPVSFGEFAFLADNYHWDNNPVDAATHFRTLIEQTPFPVYPDTLSIIMCCTGSFSLTSCGVRLSAGQRDAIITLGGQPVEAVQISRDCKIIFFSGRSKYFNTQIDLDDANRILRHALELRHPFLFHLTLKEFRATEKLYFSAKEFLQMSPEQTKGGIISGYARILSTLIAARVKQEEEEEKGEESPVSGVNRTLLASFLDNVRNNCRKERGVAFYSSLANLTPKYFAKQIRKLSGKSPGAIIEEYTMAEAKTLLSSKKYSVKEVSNLMNFSSPSSFCKYFKAAEGIAPGQYMKRN